MAAKPIPIGIAVQIAVCAPTCTLPAELRHLLMVLAVLADRNTGRGISGQDRIAQAMGMKATRSVRRMLAELAGRSDSPATVGRRPRMASDGRGRTSDEYQLRLADQADAGVRVDTHDQPDADVRLDATSDDTTNRTPDADQPDVEHTTNRTPTSRDPVRDPVSYPVRIGPTKKAAKKSSKRSKRAAPIPADWTPTETHKAFAVEHGLGLELERIAFLGHYDGQPVKSPNGRFTTWLAKGAQWKRERAARPHGRPQQPKQPNSGWRAPGADGD